MKLCSMTGGRLGLWRNKGRRDDRPFPPRQILPIAGFRGNRVMYGESWWTPEEEVDKVDKVDKVEEEILMLAALLSTRGGSEIADFPAVFF